MLNKGFNYCSFKMPRKSTEQIYWFFSVDLGIGRKYTSINKNPVIYDSILKYKQLTTQFVNLYKQVWEHKSCKQSDQEITTI